MIDEHPVSVIKSTDVTDTIELVEEVVVVSNRIVTTGSVSVRTVTEAFEDEVAADLSTKKAIVERIAIDRIIDQIPQTRTEGDVTIVPVFEEVLVIERRVRLIEELHIRYEMTTESVRLPVTVRKQRAVVERLPVGDPAINQPYEE